MDTYTLHGTSKVFLCFVALSLVWSLSYLSNFVVVVGKTYTQDAFVSPPDMAEIGEFNVSESDPVTAAVEYYKGEDGEMIFNVPRTSSAVYNDVVDEERYFMYSPSGGFNNQRLELEYALRMAKVFNRTLVVPMAAKHSDLWRGYWYLSQEDLYPMDRIIDFQHMESYGVKLLPLNTTLSKFVDRVSNKYGKTNVTLDYASKFKARERLGLHACDLDKQYREGKKRRKYKFLFFKGHFYCHYYKPEEMGTERRSVRYASSLRNIALILVQKKFGNQKFSAIHVRLGDYESKLKFSIPSFISKMEKKKFTGSGTVYVATEPSTDRKLLAPIKKKYETWYLSDLNVEVVRGFRKAVGGSGALKNDMLGIIEQLICVFAERFAGTGISTFSRYIYWTRTHRDTNFPESYPAKLRFVRGLNVSLLEVPSPIVDG